MNEVFLRRDIKSTKSEQGLGMKQIAAVIKRSEREVEGILKGMVLI